MTAIHYTAAAVVCATLRDVDPGTTPVVSAAAVVRALDERGLLHHEPPRPRVWQAGDETIPADTWVMTRRGGVLRMWPGARKAMPLPVGDDPLVEVRPPDYDAEVARAAAERTEAGR